MRRLFHAYREVDVIPNEISLYEFISRPKNGISVGKRSYKDIFSTSLADGDLLQAISLLNANPQVKIVNIFRDGRDVIESGEMPKRWIDAIRQMLNHQSLIAVNLRYEDLVKAPDSVQDLIAKTLGLEIENPFSEYPNFFYYDDVSSMTTYKPRPISTDRIGKNLELYKSKIKDDGQLQTFENLLRTLGYVD